MKTPSTTKKKPERSEELIRSLDALDHRMAAVETLAGMMQLCLELPQGAPVDARTFGRAGLLIGHEIESLRKEARQLREMLAR